MESIHVLTFWQRPLPGGLLTASAVAAQTVEGIPQPRRPDHGGTDPWSAQPDARWTEPRRDLRPPAVGDTEKRI